VFGERAGNDDLDDAALPVLVHDAGCEHGAGVGGSEVAVGWALMRAERV
jgi:hypothetical protein